MTLYGEKDFANGIKLRKLIWNYPGLSGWALKVITSDLIGERQREI